MNYFNNGWNWLHFAGALFIGLFCFAAKGYSVEMSFLVALPWTPLKEIGDQICHYKKVKWMQTIGFDPAGWSLADIGMMLAGNTLAAVINSIGG